MDTATTIAGRSIPWNKGKLLGQKPPLRLKEIWAIRIRLQLDHRVRELALLNLAIDSKLRGCDLVGLRVHHACCPRRRCSRLHSQNVFERGHAKSACSSLGRSPCPYPAWKPSSLGFERPPGRGVTLDCP